MLPSIAHAGGAIDEKTYTNSTDALDEDRAKGVVRFELAFQQGRVVYHRICRFWARPGRMVSRLCKGAKPGNPREYIWSPVPYRVYVRQSQAWPQIRDSTETGPTRMLIFGMATWEDAV